MGYGYTNVSATTAAVANRFVASTNMIVGAYTVANPSPVWAGACLVTVTHTTATGTDTLGTIAIVGTDINNRALTETITPLDGTVATGTKFFRTITTITGAGWVINGGNDTIVVGCAAGAYVATSAGTLRALVVNTTAAATVVLSDQKGTIATLKASIAEGTYYYDVDYAGYLKIATTSTNDVTAIHTATLPTSYSL